MIDKDLIKRMDEAHDKYYAFGQMNGAELWKYMSDNYFNVQKYEVWKFDEIVTKVSDDFEVYPKDIREKLCPTKEFRDSVNSLEKAHNRKRKAVLNAMEWVKTADYPYLIKKLKLTRLWTWFKERNVV